MSHLRNMNSNLFKHFFAGKHFLGCSIQKYIALIHNNDPACIPGQQFNLMLYKENGYSFLVG